MSDKEYDTHDPQGQSATELPSLEWQKEVNDIVFAHIFSLLISGFCVAFSRDYSSLKAFGCLCYASLHPDDKFGPRAVQCVFVGYPFLQKGYKVLSHSNSSVPFTTTTPCNSYSFQNWLSHDFSATSSSDETNAICSSSLPDGSPSDLSTSPSPTRVSSSPDVHQPTISSSINPPVRQSTRSKSRPTWWDDYQGPLHSKSVMSTVQHTKLLSDSPIKLVLPTLPIQDPLPPIFTDSLDPLSMNMAHHSYDTTHQEIQAYSHNSKVLFEPTHYYQAIKDSRWVDAINKELDALKSNHTWKLMPLPPNKTCIGCKWVFKIKYLPDGQVERFKARLVAKGYTQTAGIDYHDTFAPVVKLVTVRSLLAVAVAKGWFIEQLDINNAFLHGDLTEEVYMQLPLGYHLAGFDSTANLVSGYKQSKLDHSLFTFTSGNSFIAVVVYVDDILLSGNDFSLIKSLKALLHERFSIKDLGAVKFYLGLEVLRNNQGFFLSQHKFIIDLLKSANMEDCKPLSVPLDPYIKLYDNDLSGPLLSTPTFYKAIVGKLLYLTSSRPDICFSVQLLSQFLHAQAHLVAVERVLRYLKLTSQHGLFFSDKSSLTFQGFSDSDWGGDPGDRRSVGEYCFLLGSTAISWRSKKQSLTSKSTCEAEYRALSDASCEVIWLKSLLTELSVRIPKSIALYCDNKAALDLAANPVYHARTKHIELDCHFIREKILTGLIEVFQVTSQDNSADILTKGLGKVPHWSCASKMGLTFLSPSSLCGGLTAGAAYSDVCNRSQDSGGVLIRPTTVKGGADETNDLTLVKGLVSNKLKIPFIQTRPYAYNRFS
ncbi:hypothetical protein AgCh_006393 [Apium graveolens]